MLHLGLHLGLMGETLRTEYGKIVQEENRQETFNFEDTLTVMERFGKRIEKLTGKSCYRINDIIPNIPFKSRAQNIVVGSFSRDSLV